MLGELTMDIMPTVGADHERLIAQAKFQREDVEDFFFDFGREQFSSAHHFRFHGSRFHHHSLPSPSSPPKPNLPVPA
jgi:hypothetical protein